MKNIRAILDSATYDGRPIWRGQYRAGRRWLTVCNQSGNPIAYVDAESARVAAEFTLDALAELAGIVSVADRI